jgi:hypothetical protein
MPWAPAMACGDQDLFGRAPAVRAGAAEIPFFDKRDLLAGVMGDGRHAETGISAAEDDDVVSFRHGLASLPAFAPTCHESRVSDDKVL